MCLSDVSVRAKDSGKKAREKPFNLLLLRLHF
jgi:hypothetical protein